MISSSRIFYWALAMSAALLGAALGLNPGRFTPNLLAITSTKNRGTLL